MQCVLDEFLLFLSVSLLVYAAVFQIVSTSVAVCIEAISPNAPDVLIFSLWNFLLL